MKIKKIFVLMIYSIWILQVNAQVETVLPKNNSQFIISFSTALAIPTGEFAYFETEPYAYQYQGNIAGIAKPGIEGRLSAIYMFSKHFGINGIISGTINSSKPVEKADLFYEGGSHGGLGGGYARESYNYSTESWKTLNFITGLVYSLRDEKKILQFRIGGGLQIVQSPETHLSDSGYSWIMGMPPLIYPYKNSYVQPTFTSNCFVYNLGLDAGTDLKNNLGILFSLDYLSSSPTFKGDKKFNNISYNNSIQTTTSGTIPISFSKTISLLCLGVSIIYSF